jgi:hypothetical protein
MKSKIIKIVGRIWAVIGISLFIWIYFSFKAKIFDDSILDSNSSIMVNVTDDFIAFTPTSMSKNVIFFYPGALVDPFAYAPLCRKLSENDYQVMIIRMPWRMATKGYNKIKKLDLLKDKSKNFILAGHSQGGMMAAQFVYENPNIIDKLILLGTTHPRDIDLSNTSAKVLKIYGSNDGVAPKQKVINNKSKLPLNTTYIEIEGGNHSQFGYYGFQLNDSNADITQEKQQALIFKNIIDFVNME